MKAANRKAAGGDPAASDNDLQGHLTSAKDRNPDAEAAHQYRLSQAQKLIDAVAQLEGVHDE